FDITAGPYTRLWRQARRQKKLAGPILLKQAAQSVGHEKLDLNSTTRTVTCLALGMRLDLGGIAKGWAADEALSVLRKHGITRSLCAASGDIAIGDSPPGKEGWEVGVRALDKHGNFYNRTLSLRNCAVSTSGDTFQFIEIGGQRYSHIVNPRTGLGLTNRIMVSVIADKAMETDSQATAISVLGAQNGMTYAKKKGIAVIITPMHGKNQTVRTSPQWQECFR
ncbi:MAG: FAD:protein FMN transferase, partial [Verrucomicrobiota bacterium]|nr:FAD:protein FMN transferase [Verrucomicrobiota bacterium]